MRSVEPGPTPAQLGPAPAEIDTSRIAASRLWAARRFPYLAKALFASPVVAADGLGGCAVDRWWRLYVDPELLRTWTVPQVAFELLHHCGHLLRDHAARAVEQPVTAARTAAWVAAADAEINDDLAGQDLDDVEPANPLIVPATLGCAPGRLAEEYFRPAEACCRGGLCPRDCGSGAHGQDRPWESGGSRGSALRAYQGDLVRRQVAADIVADAKQAGRMPAGLRRWAEQLTAPKVDWRRVLAAEVRRGLAATVGSTDYTYSRPSRRASAAAGVVLPALRGPAPQVAVICDTSGSMTDEMLARALAEIDGIVRSVGVRSHRVRVLACDAAVHTVRRVRRVGEIELVGGGGTDMGAGIAAAYVGNPRPDVVVVLTDGFTPWPDVAPAGMRVIAGLLGPPGAFAEGQPGRVEQRVPPPSWVRTVHIDDDANTPAPAASGGGRA